MMVERKRHLAAVIALALALVMSIAAAVPMVYSWLSNPTLSNAQVDASIKGSYFEDGDGSEAKPYIIARPIQLYYLAWLQDIGYFNKEDDENPGNVRQFFFELRGDSYGRNGGDPLPGVVENGIFDMTGYKLPPIGTTEHPFVGHFNGNGFVVTNLHVTNDAFTNAPKEGESTNGTQALGFFGVVGSTGNENKVGALSYDPEKTGVASVVLHNLTVESAAPNNNQTLVGLAAGYVNAPVTEIAVSESNIIVADSVTGPIALNANGNESDFGLVGYCTENYKEDLQVERVTISLPTYTQNIIYRASAGEGSEWGGSIDMLQMHTRLQNVLKEAKKKTAQYPTSETVIVDEVTGTITRTPGASTNYPSLTDDDGRTAIIRTYQSELGGSFVFADENNATYSARYNLFHGKSTKFPKTVTTITYKNEFLNGFTILNSGNYLNAATSGIESGTNAETATVWVLDNAGHLNALVESTSSVDTKYLNASGAGVLSLGNSGTTVWTKNNDGTLSYTSGGRTWYLRYDNGWSGYPFDTAFSIYNDSVYLGRSNGTNLAGTAGNHALWHLESGKMMAYISNTLYYLNANGDELSLGTSATTTTWADNGDGTFSYTANGITWYLCLVNGAWSAFPATAFYQIHNGVHYLSASGTNVAATETATDAVRWVFADGRLYTVTNHAIYYLNATDSISLSTTPSTTWAHNNNGTLTYSYGGQTWYLYDQNGTWAVHPASAVQLVSQNGVYLNIASTTTVSGGTDEGTATAWFWDSANGRLSTYYNGNTYYLNAAGSTVSVSTSATTTWARGGDGALTSGGNYLFYDGTWTMLSSDTTFYLIKSGSDYLSNSGSTLQNGDAAAATRWQKDGNGRFYIKVGNTTYYLRAQTTGLSLNATANNGTVFTYDSANHRMTCTISGNTYYLVYRIYDNTWTVRNTAVGDRTLFISTTSGNTTYYLNASTSTVSTGTAQGSATEWVYNGTSGTVSTVINGTTYYLRAALETNNTRASTNLTVTTTAGQATTFTYSANHLTCTLSAGGSNRTYSLVLDNNTLKMVDTGKTYYTIYVANSRYLNFSGTTIQTNGTSADSAVLWEFSNATVPTNNYTTTTVSTLVSGDIRYLAIANENVSLTTTSTNLRYYRSGSNYALRNSNNNYYLNFYRNEWTTYTSIDRYAYITRTEVSFTAATVDLTTAVSYVTDQETQTVGSSANNTFTELTAANMTFTAVTSSCSHTTDSVSLNTVHTLTDKQRQTYTKAVTTEAGGYDTYFPLAADSTATFDVSNKNTGYIVGGSYAGYQSEWGDVRIAYYDMSSLSNSLYNVNTYRNNSSRLEVLTRTYLSNGWKRISDDFNGNNSDSNVATALRNYSKVAVSDLGLQKYNNARSQLDETFSNKPTQIYGMHFMDAVISMDHLITAPKVVINGTTYENFELPEDSIDFTLKAKGYINFFAGSYYTNTGKENNSFFSLNEIIRDPVTKKITDIKRIVKIYGDPTSERKAFIYQYEGESAPSLPSGYVEMFDTAWIETPNMGVNNNSMVWKALYYFEVPVNAGEYALGSVEGRYGAYLCYLDIGASGSSEDKDRTTVAEQFTTVPMNFSVPKGVQLVATKDSYSAYTDYNTYTDYLDSVSVKLLSGFTGTVPFSRTSDNTFSFTPSDKSVLSYVGGSINAITGSGSTPYYPNGYTVKLVENITDVGRTTSTTDRMRVETLDTYNSSGVLESRTVTLYAGIDYQSDATQIAEIVTFTYDPTGHENMITRLVRSAAVSGFIFSFSEDITIETATLHNNEAHVIFGSNVANVLIELNNSTSVDGTLIPSVALADDTTEAANVYHKSAIGEDFVTYDYFVAPESTVTLETTPTFTPTNEGGVLSSLSLSYAITLSPELSADNRVYAKLLKPLNQAIDSTTWRLNADGSATVSASVPVTVTAVTVNGNNLTYNEVTVLPSGS